jgi:type I restriction enzyme S subunit
VTGAWPTESLADLASSEQNSFVDGPFGSSLKADEYVEEGVPIIRLQNIRPNRFLNGQIRFITPAKARALARHDYRPGDLVIAKLGDPCGMACVLPNSAGSGRIVADVVRFRGEPKKIDHHYLSYFINSPMGRGVIARDAKGATRQRVNLSNFKALEVPVPPLDQQRRIAAVLDQAHALRAKRREILAKLDKLTEAIFIELFGDPATNLKNWKDSRIGAIGDVQGGLQLSGARAALPLEVPYLRVANVFRNRLDLSEIKRFRATDSEVARTLLARDDILIVEGHGNAQEIGRCALWDGSIEICSHQNHLIRLRVDKSKADPVFVSRFLNSQGGRKGLIAAGNTTSGLNTISVSKVRDCRLLLPPLKLQRLFAHRLGAVSRMQLDQAKAAASLDRLFASLQHRAFRGEL